MRWSSVTGLSDGLGGTTGDIGPHQSSVHNEQRDVLKEQSAEDCSSALGDKEARRGPFRYTVGVRHEMRSCNKVI